MHTETKLPTSPFWWMAGGMFVGAVIGIFLGAQWAIAAMVIGALVGYLAGAEAARRARMTGPGPADADRLR